MKFYNHGISRLWNFENPELKKSLNFRITEFYNLEFYDPGIIVFQTYRNLERIKYF